MKQLFLAFFLLLYTKPEAQPNPASALPISSTEMNAYLQTHKPAVLTIKINHLPDSAKKTMIKCTYVTFGSDFQISKYYQTNENGFAKIVLDQNLPFQQIWVNIDHYLYTGIYVNNELNITVDASKIKGDDGVYMFGDGIEYSGKDGEFNTVMNKQVLYKQDSLNKLDQDLNSLCNPVSRKKYTDSVFLFKTDSLYQMMLSIDNEFIAQHPDYAWAIRNELNAKYFGYLCLSYLWDIMPNSLKKKINYFSPYFTSNDGVLFYNYLFQYIIYKKDNPKMSIENELYKNYASYNIEKKLLLDSLKYYKGLNNAQKTNQGIINALSKKRQDVFLYEIEEVTIESYIKIIDSIYTNPESDILKTFLLKSGKNTFAQTYPEIGNSMRVKWCRDIVVNALNVATIRQKKVDSLLAIKTNLNETKGYIGKPLESLPFNASLYLLDSLKNVDDFIVDLKSEFPNKALIIDFWATWCTPCLSELPRSKKLHEDNKDLPIDYIYICTNSSSNLKIWKNKIAELQLPGTHIFANDKIVDELKGKFNSEGSGFPTYIVIDANGKIKPAAIEWMQGLTRNTLIIASGLSEK